MHGTALKHYLEAGAKESNYFETNVRDTIWSQQVGEAGKGRVLWELCLSLAGVSQDD